ncbi:hypothetical protein [Nocardioides aestuarii]|uniref:XRE family transcriptional regulator n=1 Tax=Nocardioides aestuarii TaxID=252231 RepID=A0ABW4TS37_9ACTN
MTEQDGASAFAEAFDSAVRARGVSLTWLHRRLTELATPVSVATLSYWRSGRSEPERKTSLAAVAVLEEVLGLDGSSLSRHLRPVRRPGPPGRAVPIEDLTADPDATRRALGALGFETAHDELVEYAVMLTLDHDETGRATRMTVLTRYRALVEGARRLATVVTLDHRDDGPPVFEPKGGVEVGRSVVDDDQLLTVAELLLERPVERGGDAFGHYDVVLSPSERRDGSLAYYAPRRVGQSILWARFHPDAVPRSFEAFEVVDGEELSEPVDIGGGRSLHRVASQFGPGTVGVRWTW